jgi:hypothetical protein
LNDPNPARLAQFGAAVAGVGDVNRDGVPDVMIGAPNQMAKIPNQGQVFLFSGANGALLHTFDNPTPQRANFGFAVAGVGDVNQDNVPDLLVGAPNHDVGRNSRQGRAFIFSGATGALLRTLENPNPRAAALFGFAVADAGDVNRDGVTDLLIAASDQSVGKSAFQGQAFIISGSDGKPLLTLDTPNPQTDTDFGHSAAGLGDLNGDGIPDFLIGAPSQDFKGALFFGQAYVLSGAGVHDLAVTKLLVPRQVTLTGARPAVTKEIIVEIQNRSTHAETIPDLATLRRLLNLRVESLGACPSPAPVLVPGPLPRRFPLTLGARKELTLSFAVTFDCANDPTAGSPDYRYVTKVNHPALDRVADSHPADDTCPRDALAALDHNPGVGRSIKDKGCGGKKPSGNFGAEVLTDVRVLP